MTPLAGRHGSESPVSARTFDLVYEIIPTKQSILRQFCKISHRGDGMGCGRGEDGAREEEEEGGDPKCQGSASSWPDFSVGDYVSHSAG